MLRLRFLEANEYLLPRLLCSMVFIEVSGGKDSTLALLYMYDRFRKYRGNMRILYIRTPLSHPLNDGYIYHLGGKLGIPVIVLENSDVMKLSKDKVIEICRKGLCMWLFKKKPLTRFIREHKGVYVLGVRKFESRRRRRYELRLVFDRWYRIYIYYPLLYMTNDERDQLLESLRRKYGVGVNPCWLFKYNINRSSGDCYPCLLYKIKNVVS